MRRRVTMNKKIVGILIGVIIGILSISKINIFAAETKAEIWSYSLDERIEHRSIKVGDNNSNFGIMVTPDSVVRKSTMWSMDNTDIARVDGNSETATVYGIKEGTTTLRLNIKTESDGTLTHSSIISVYTPVYNISGRVSSKVTFYRGADDDSWIRSTDVPAGQSVTIIGSCGDYYYLKLPDSYTFDDNRETRYTYALKSKIYVPVDGITTDIANIDITKNESVKINNIVTPNIATNKTVTYSSNNFSVASVDNSGKVTGKSEGYVIITIKTESENKVAKCGISVYTPRSGVKAEVNKSANLLVGADDKEAIRSKWVEKGQELSIIGYCGNYYYVKLPDYYKFADGNTSRVAYILKSNVYIPVESITLNQKNITMGSHDTQKLTATVLPDIASNKNVIWSVNKNNIVSVDNVGNIKSIGSGEAKVVAKTESGGKTAICTVNIVKGLESAKLGEISLKLIKTDLSENILKYSSCAGATEYILYRGIKRSDGTIKWEDIERIYDRYNKGEVLYDDLIEVGKTYYYKMVAKKIYARGAFDFVTLDTKTSNIIKVVSGKPELSGHLNGKKSVKISWHKLSHEYCKKSGYMVYRKTNKQGSYKKIKTINKKSTIKFSDNTTKYNTNYKYKIRAFYINRKKKTLFSPYSNVITVKTKKK